VKRVMDRRIDSAWGAQNKRADVAVCRQPRGLHDQGLACGAALRRAASVQLFLE
jgi:hypothetical protein